MTPVRLEPAASWSRVKHSITEPLRSVSISSDGWKTAVSTGASWSAARFRMRVGMPSGPRSGQAALCGFRFFSTSLLTWICFTVGYELFPLSGGACLISFWADVWIFLYRSQSVFCLVDLAFLWALCFLRVARRILVFIYGCVCLDEDISGGTHFSTVVIITVLRFCHIYLCYQYLPSSTGKSGA